MVKNFVSRESSVQEVERDRSLCGSCCAGLTAMVHYAVEKETYPLSFNLISPIVSKWMLLPGFHLHQLRLVNISMSRNYLL